MQRLRAFEVRYLSATDTKESRINIVDKRNHKSKVIPFTSRYDDSWTDAINYLKQKGIEISGRASNDGYDILLSENFGTSIK